MVSRRFSVSREVKGFYFANEMTKIEFKSLDGFKLVGILEDPPNEEAGRCRSDVVLFLHGLYQHKNVSFLREFGSRIPRDVRFSKAFGGLSTFRFDCRGLGESEGKTVYAPHLNHLRDLESAIVFLERDLKRRVVAIFGYAFLHRKSITQTSHGIRKHTRWAFENKQIQCWWECGSSRSLPSEVQTRKKHRNDIFTV